MHGQFLSTHLPGKGFEIPVKCPLFSGYLLNEDWPVICTNLNLSHETILGKYN